MSLSFLVPAFLAGLLAIGVPVLIHLTRKQSQNRIPFPSLMFLRGIPHETQRRRRIHRWPLLLLRCAAIILLVLAFARPFVETDGDATRISGSGDREVVILVDRSYSMSVGERWDRARQAADEIISGLSAGDRGTVILFDTHAESASESTTDREILRAALEGAEPGPRTTRFTPALRYAGRILGASPLPQHELVVISDFQRNAWDSDGREAGSLRFPAGTGFRAVGVTDTDPVRNVSIAGVDFEREQVEGRERVEVVGRLTASEIELDQVPVTLEVDGRVIERQTVTIRDGTANVRFNPLTLPGTGTTKATLRIPDDALALDNAFHFVLGSDERIGVLIVDGARADPRTSYFLERALAIGSSPGFRTRVRAADELRAADLAENRVVILNQAAIPPEPLGTRIQEHVEEGGGVVMVLGENPTGSWPSVLPQIPEPVDRSDGGTAIGYVDTGHPIFEAFAGPRSGDFGAARIYRYRPLPAGSFPRVLARFGDGGPALAERPVGDGRLLVWASTLDGRWNDLTLQPVFLPFLHQLVRYAAGYSPPRSWMTVGEAFDPQAIIPSGEQFTLAVAPGGEQQAINESEPVELGQLGFYEFRDPRAPDRALTMAVNVDPVEANLSAFDPEELRSALAGAATALPAERNASLSIAERERQQSGWWYLVIAGFLLLIAETLFSNRTSGKTRSDQRLMT